MVRLLLVLSALGAIGLAGALDLRGHGPVDASIDVDQAPPVDGFDWPLPCCNHDVGDRDHAGYYDAQVFGENAHLGEDWNGVGGGNTDLGDPVGAVAAGIVTEAQNRGGGWGNVVRVVHNRGPTREPQWVESLYAHLQDVVVQPGQILRRGQLLGTIGTADGRYPAHLHLELRDTLGLPLGRGYGRESEGYLSPSLFIGAHRQAWQDKKHQPRGIHGYWAEKVLR